MQNEVDKSTPIFPVLQQQLRQATPPLMGGGTQCVRPSTSGSAGSPGSPQRTNSVSQSQSRSQQNGRMSNSSQPIQSSPLQQSSRPRTASSSNVISPPQPARAPAAPQEQSKILAVGAPNTPTYARPTTSTEKAGTVAALILPPSPPLTRSATRSRSSVITAAQNQQYVDYLLQNGGIAQPISITFSPQRDPHALSYLPTTNSAEVPELSYPAPGDDADEKLMIFAPLHYSLDSYTQVLTNGGSIAVGTGYRSVARRLLERVEALFARDIGLPWGETLEWLRGKRRRERLPVLPVLPVRGLLKKGISGSGAGVDDAETVLGNNNEGRQLQITAPPIAQPALTKPPADGQGVHQMLAEGEKIRTKTKVEEWLEETETVLSTAIGGNAVGSNGVGRGSTAMTGGKSNDVAGIFYDALADQFHTPANHYSDSQHFAQDAASTTSQEEEEERIVSGIILDLLNESPPQKNLYAQYLADCPLLDRTILALKRLYPTHPAHTITRSIAALYLLLHPDLHPVLDAIAKITKGELDLLNSGKFDGFLDEKDVIPADEDKELEALEVLDGNIFRTMEKLEDEIEALHVRAEEVRRMLRVRKEAIARKIIMAGKEKDGAAASNEQPIGQSLTRQNTSPSNASTTLPGKHMLLPPPPPKSDYFEGLDKESTLNPIYPDDSASNYGSRHRRRTSRKAASSAVAGDDGNGDPRRESSGSVGSNGLAGLQGSAGTAAQHLMKKQLDREKERRDKERRREKYEKERERREKEERRKTRLENAAANIGFHHNRNGVIESRGPELNTPPPPYASVTGPNEQQGSPSPPKRTKSTKDEHKDKEKLEKKDRERDRHRSPERPSTSERRPAMIDYRSSRELMSPAPPTTGGTTVVATAPPTLMDDLLAPVVALRERASREKKKDKSEKDRRKDIDDQRPATPDDKVKESLEKRRFFKFTKFLGSDHADSADSHGTNTMAADNIRPGTSGSIRPGTSYTMNTVMTNATTTTAVGSDAPTSSKSHRKERRHHKDHKRETIPEEQDEDDDEKIVRHHHTTRRRSSRRNTTTTTSSSLEKSRAMEVLSEPEEVFGREDQPRYTIAGVFSDDEDGRGHAYTGFGGLAAGADAGTGIKQQLRRSLRRSSESKKVGDSAFLEEFGKEKARRGKEKEKEREEREKEREEKRERKRVEEKERISMAPMFAPPSVAAPVPLAPSHPPPPPPAPMPSALDDTIEADLAPASLHLQKPSSESLQNQQLDDKKPGYKISFSSSTGGQEGNFGGGGVSLLGSQQPGAVGGDKISPRASIISREDDEATVAVTEDPHIRDHERSPTPRQSRIDADAEFVDSVD